MPILPGRGRRPSPRRQPAAPPAGQLEELADGQPPPARDPQGPAPAPAPARTPASPPSSQAPSSQAPSNQPSDQPPRPARFGGRFPTAAAALVFAGQVEDLGRGGTLEITHSPSTRTWWALADLPIATCRELVDAARGEPWAEVEGELLPDRGWGAAPTRPTRRTATGEPPPDRVQADLLDLVRVCGLHRTADAPPDELLALLPGHRVNALVQRALDLDLDVGYQVVGLEPLFADDGRDGGRGTPEIRYLIALHGRSGAPPRAFLAALERDPFVLACRRVGAGLLIQHQTASALPDRQLARLAETRRGTGVWVLAEPDFGCRVLTAQGTGELRDAAELVRLDNAYELVSPAPEQSGDAVAEVQIPTLQLVAATTHGVAVDAMLLDDADLACVPDLLEGGPLAEVALLARGRDHHLVLAPGGLLERLAVGEPLYRVGPGPLYLPLGRRLRPALPPEARQRIFETDEHNAVVFVRSDRGLAFDLTGCQPIWTLWAGERPPIDVQLPDDIADVLGDVDGSTVSEAPAPPRKAPPSPDADPAAPGPGRGSPAGRPRPGPQPAPRLRTWREEAWLAERAGDLARAAELHEANNDLRRAAHLYELAARQASRRMRPDAW